MFPHCLLFALGYLSLKPTGCRVGPGLVDEMLFSRRAHTNEYSPELLLQCLCPHAEPQTPPTSAGDTPILAGNSGPVCTEVSSFIPGSWCALDLVCTLKGWSFYFLQSCGIPVIKCLWPSEPDSLGPPAPISRDANWEASHVAQDFYSCGIMSVL